MVRVSYKNVIYSCIGLISVVLIGTFGYWFITEKNYDLFDCFYMTIITITTIGYHEILDFGSYEGARLFTVFLALIGIGLLTYFLSSIAVILIEGHIKETFKRSKMEKRLVKLKDHYIVCGLNKNSEHLVEELISTKRNFILIESDEKVIEDFLKQYPSLYYIQGNGSSDNVLTKAGIAYAKGVFAATDDDNLNLVISLSSKHLNPNVRVLSYCFDRNNMDKIDLAGADKVISPNFIGALRMASEMVRPTVTSFLDTMLRDTDKNLRIEEISISEKHYGETIGTLRRKEFSSVLILALKEKETWLYNPKDDVVIGKDNTLVIMTTPQDRMKMEKAFS